MLEPYALMKVHTGVARLSWLQLPESGHCRNALCSGCQWLSWQSVSVDVKFVNTGGVSQQHWHQDNVKMHNVKMSCRASKGSLQSLACSVIVSIVQLNRQDISPGNLCQKAKSWVGFAYPLILVCTKLLLTTKYYVPSTNAALTQSMPSEQML